MLYQKFLLEACIQSGVRFDRIFILTGQDYPLWSNAQIIQELEHNPDKEYMLGLNLTHVKNPPRKILDKITLYHFFRDLNVPYKLKKCFSGGSRLIMRLLPIRKKPYIIVEGKKWDVYQASAYMCITYGLAEYILRELSENKIVTRYFKTSFAPDEMVVPTIVFNSPYKDRCNIYEKGTYDGLKSLSAITYFNYGKQIQVFTLDDYEELKNSGKIFARKFATGNSDTLMDRLDKEHGIKSI